MEEKKSQDLAKNKKPTSKVMLVIGVGAGVIVVGAALLVLNFYFKDNNNDYSIKIEKPTQKTDLSDGPYRNQGEVQIEQKDEEKDEEKEEISKTGEDDFGEYVWHKGSWKEYTDSPANEDFEIAWYKGAKKIKKSEMTENLIDEFIKANDTYVYELGKVSSPGRYAGKSLYLFLIHWMEMGSGFTDSVVVYDEELEKFVLLANEQTTEMLRVNSVYTLLTDYSDMFLGFVESPFEELETPTHINIPGQNSKLEFRRSLSLNNSIFESTGAPSNRGGILDVMKNKIAEPYAVNKIVFTDKNYGPVYYVDNIFRIFLADGSVQEYELIPDFLIKTEGQEKMMYTLSYIPNITWEEGYEKAIGQKYRLGGEVRSGGCGAGILTLDNIANEEEWFSEGNLIKIGTTKNGDSIYELNDKETNSYYKDFFDFGYEGGKYFDEEKEEEKEMTDEEKYADFLIDVPIFFWKDHMGNWRYYLNAKFQTLAECAKPVIYLYPEKETKVNVQVAPNGGFTKTDPQYPRGGWNVLAKPSGELYYFANAQTYPYLFWEGHSDGFGFPDSGFVFSRQEVPTGMRELLYKTGLSKQEIEDFMEFWEEKLTVKPFVFVTFTPQKEFEKGAPLKVTPSPDTVIRVFMDYKPLDERVEVEPLTIRTPERKGFTVIEWGGVLHK